MSDGEGNLAEARLEGGRGEGDGVKGGTGG